MIYQSSKVIPLGSCAFRQPFAESHCRFLHGYRLQAKIWVSCQELDNKNWVFDFGGFKEIKNILEKQFDHTTVISLNDPHLETFKQLSDKGIIDLRVMDGVGIEKFAEFVLFTANDYVKQQTNNRCWVSEVEVWEHEQNSAKVMNNFTLQAIQMAKELKVETKDLPTETINNTQPTQQANSAANPLYAKKSTGWSDPFKGTSWGNK